MRHGYGRAAKPMSFNEVQDLMFAVAGRTRVEGGYGAKCLGHGF